MKTHLVFIVEAYNEKFADGTMGDYTQLQLIDVSPEKAINRAKQIIKKKFYRLATVIEKEG